MLIWVLAVFVLLILGVTGLYQGAIRSLVSLVGLLVAAFAALPLGPYLQPLVPKVGLTHPVWGYLLPPLVVFLVIVLIFTAVAFLVHRQVMLYFKYKTDDVTRMRWERLSQRLGLGIGLIAGTVYIVLLGVIIYALGYPVVQFAGETTPGGLRLLGKARQDMKDTGIERAMAALDPMPELYYRATDVLGLIYHNPVLQDRLSIYPPFLSLGQRQEFQDIANDADIQNLWQTKGDAWVLFNNPKIQGLMTNGEVLAQLQALDLKDLYDYLRTGKSAKYDSERILGRWRVDAPASLIRAKNKNPDMTAAQMKVIKGVVTLFMPRTTLLAGTDNNVTIKSEPTDEAKRILQAARAAAEAAARAAEEGGIAAGTVAPRMDARMMERYGLARPQQTQEPAAARATPALLPGGIPQIDFSASGTWERVGDRYQLKLQDSANRPLSVEASLTDEEMLVPMKGFTLVFIK